MSTLFPWFAWCVVIIVVTLLLQLVLNAGLWWVIRRHDNCEELAAKHQLSIFKIAMCFGATAIATVTFLAWLANYWHFNPAV